MNATNAMLCWNPGTDEVALVPWPDYGRRSGRYRMTCLACDERLHRMTITERMVVVLAEAMTLIVGDRCTPLAVHRALLELDEYRAVCPADLPGVQDARQRYGETD